MISFEFDSLLKVEASHGLSEHELSAAADQLSSFLEMIHSHDQDFYRVLDDEPMISRIEEFCRERQGRFDDVVILGIGGSALGPLCIQQTLKPFFENQLPYRDYPRLHVLDNIDPHLLRDLDVVIDYKRTLFLVITKSGTTPETLAQYFYFSHRLKEQNLSIEDHFVFITDPERGYLRQLAQHHSGIPTFPIPPKVGGRFSVLTSVGLLPAALIGVNIRELIDGAKKMRDRFLSLDFEQNLPFQLAVIQYALAQKGKTQHVLMPYSSRLIRFTEWYRQLLAESIGKAMNRKGERVHVGITPIPALGVTDQHSQSQLYHEGPNDKFLMFMEIQQPDVDVPIPHVPLDDPAVNFLHEVTFDRLLKTEMRATLQSLTTENRPTLLISIDQLNAFSLGELFLLFKGATAFLGQFYDINAFDQPGVEFSKQLTKEWLRA